MTTPALSPVSAGDIEDASRRIAKAITPIGAIPFVDGEEHVGSLTEAVIYMAGRIQHVADALDNVASAIRDHTDANT